MTRALTLAARGRGRVEPNPMVGCVLARSQRVVGEGYHRHFGGPHAEVEAIRAAGAAARRSTAYVTLEPCSHHGKTPPCVDALVQAGVDRIVAAMRDPNPLVAGKGLARLRRAGLRVATGLLGGEAASLNAPYLTVLKRRRPHVLLKWAQSLDGQIATRAGDSKWISSVQSRRVAHALRARVDGIVVGIGTVLADDPDLTARLVRPRRTAVRIVLDSKLRTPPTCRLVRTARQTPTLVATLNRTAVSRRRALASAGCEILPVRSRGGRPDLDALARHLFRRGMTNLLVEGGGEVLSAFIRAGLADEAHVFVAPILIGGTGAQSPLSKWGADRMSRVLRPSVIRARACGPDRYQVLGFDFMGQG